MKLSIMEIIQKEKSIMRPYRYKFNQYILLVTFAIILLVIPVAILTEVNEEKYIFLLYIWFGVQVIYIVLMILMAKRVVNHEVQDELDIFSSVMNQDITAYEFPIECKNLYSNQIISFQQSDFRYMGKTFYYNDFTYTFVTTSTLRVLQSTIHFEPKNEGTGFSILFEKKSYAMFQLVGLEYEKTPCYNLFIEDRNKYIREHLSLGMLKSEWKKIHFSCHRNE